MLYLFDYVRVDVEWIRESEEQRRMQIRFNHLARVYCVHAPYKVIDFAVYLEIKIANTKEKLIQFFRQDNFEFSFMVVRALVKNCMFFFFPFQVLSAEKERYAVIIRCFDSGGYYVSSSTATFGNRFCIKDESESAIRSRLDCRAVMRTRGKMAKSIST